MAKKRKKATVAQADRPEGKKPDYRRRAVRLLQAIARKSADKIKTYSRQVDYDDVFEEYYADTEGGRSTRVLQPPYSPTRMKQLMEECGPLPACRDTYVRNVVGYGWEILPIAGVVGEESDAVRAEQELLEEILTFPNGEQSFDEILRCVERDYRTTGNAYIEVVRDVDGVPALLYWADAERTRVCPLAASVGDEEQSFVDIPVTVKRRGHDITFTRKRQFRKYVMVSTFANTGKVILRWFKEFGDPRPMDAETGEYLSEVELADRQEQVAEGKRAGLSLATEMIHRKYGSGTYGVPPWIANLTDALGVSSASYVNFDLFENQGIPPLMMLIAGGRLSEESWQDLAEGLAQAKGTENYNRVLVMEVESDNETITAVGAPRETRPDVELKPMGAFRKEDAMFTNYTEKGSEAIRAYGFRLPGIYIGKTSGEYNRATADAARQLTEEQVFSPERREFSELLQHTIVAALGLTSVKFTLRGPKIVNPSVMQSVMNTLADKGAISPNQLVAFSNEFFGTSFAPWEVSTNEEEAKLHWANQPIGFLLKPEVSKLWLSEMIKHFGGSIDSTLGPSDVEKEDKMYETLLGIEKVGRHLISDGCSDE